MLKSTISYPTHKQCNRCKNTFPIEQFPKNKTMKDGHLNQCKNCVPKKRYIYYIN